MHGTYETVDGKPAVRFERRLAQPVERVWRSVSEPAELAHWFPSQVSGELRLGSTLRFSFPGHDLPDSEGEVTELDPPRLLAFWWGTERLRFELEPDADGTLLRLTHVLGSADQAARDAAGWHVCLDRLEHVSSGDWRELYEDYEARGLPTGAPIPSEARSG